MTIFDTFNAFITCAAAGGHDFSTSGTCPRCGAAKGAPSMLDLASIYIQQANNPRPLCRPCWISQDKPSALLYAKFGVTEVVCEKCSATTPARDIVWVAR